MHKKKILIFFVLFIFIAAVLLGSFKIYRVRQARQSGILLAFDDYNPDNWASYFDLFDQYNVKVTFFVNCSEPTDFCYNAIQKGHEIGCHSIGHIDATSATEAEIQSNIIDVIDTFDKGGIKLTTFAYPYGNYNEELNDLLLQHYAVLRGGWYYQLNSKAALRHGFVEACPIDNIYYSSEEEFEAAITRILTELSENVGAVASLYSHAISGGDWCITEERLIFLFEKAEELNLKFYTFQELQKESLLHSLF